MPSPENARRPRRPCANSNNWRNGNTSVQQRSRRSILDLAKKKSVWIGWKNLTTSRTALVGILRLTRSTTAFATSRASRRWSKKFFTKHSEHTRAGPRLGESYGSEKAARVGGSEPHWHSSPPRRTGVT